MGGRGEDQNKDRRQYALGGITPRDASRDFIAVSSDIGAAPSGFRLRDGNARFLL